MQHSQDAARTQPTASRAAAEHVSKGSGSPAKSAMRKAVGPGTGSAQPLQLQEQEREGEPVQRFVPPLSQHAPGNEVMQGKFKIVKGSTYDKSNAGGIADNSTLDKKLKKEKDTSVKDTLKKMAEEDHDYGELSWDDAISIARKKIVKSADKPADVAEPLPEKKKGQPKDLYETKKEVGPKVESKKPEVKLKTTGASLTVDKCIAILKEGKLPGEITWGDIEDNIKKGIGEEKEFGETMRKLIGIVYKTVVNKDTRYKFGRSERDRSDVEKEYGTPIVEKLGPRKFSSEDDKILQQLRWISTSVFNYLNRGQKKVANEVQSLWDGEHLYITENLLSNNKEIEALLTSGSTLEKFLKNYEGKQKDKDRFKRHPANLSAAIQDAKKEKETASPVSALLGGKISVSEHSDSLEDNMHAETRLALTYISTLTDQEEIKKGKVYVAGVMRPCFACYVRLDVQKKKFKELNKTLVSNPHHGFAWVSENAWQDTSTDEKLKALEKIGLFEYIRSLENKDKTIMTEFIKEEHVYLTDFGDKGYDRDTDSEGEED